MKAHIFRNLTFLRRDGGLVKSSEPGQSHDNLWTVINILFNGVTYYISPYFIDE